MLTVFHKAKRLRGRFDGAGLTLFEPHDSYAKDHEHLGLGSVMFWPDALAVSESQVKEPSEILSIGESRFHSGQGNGAQGDRGAVSRR
jgi:hypothetical protein